MMRIKFQGHPTFNVPGTERGQALVLIAFVIIWLVGVIGLAVDGGRAFAERRRAQNAADASALAGAVERIHNNTPSWANAVFTSAALNGYNNDGTDDTVEIFSPPVTGSNAGNIEYIQVRITSHLKTYFAGIVGIPQVTIVAEAISRTTTPEYQPMIGGAAIVSLAPTSDCDNHKAFYVHEGATLTINGGGVFVNSNNPNCALMVQGEGGIRINGNYPIQVVGGASVQKPQLLSPYPPVLGAQSIPYPPPFYMPNVDCGQKKAAISQDGHSMTPGNWDGVFPPPGVDHLTSGVYCLNGGFLVGDGGSLTGEGVVFKVKHGGVEFSGNAHLNLSAYHAGNLDGLLLYLPADNTDELVLNADANSSFQGTILSPGALVHIKGSGPGYGLHSQIIGYRIEVDGGSNVFIKYVENQNYDALSFPELQFSQ